MGYTNWKEFHKEQIAMDISNRKLRSETKDRRDSTLPFINTSTEGSAEVDGQVYESPYIPQEGDLPKYCYITE